jgi:hypothetical protein
MLDQISWCQGPADLKHKFSLHGGHFTGQLGRDNRVKVPGVSSKGPKESCAGRMSLPSASAGDQPLWG